MSLSVEWVKKHIDIVGVVGHYVPLEDKGQYAIGLCPFHGDQNPSFAVYKDSQRFVCLACGVAGDSIEFIRLYKAQVDEEPEELSFYEALQFLWKNKSNWTRDAGAVRRDGPVARVGLLLARVVSRLQRITPAISHTRRYPSTSPDELFSQRYSPLQVKELLAETWADSLFTRVAEGMLSYEDYLEEEQELQRFTGRSL